MNVLSLFDGMSCGQLALNRAGFKVANYYSSEIDKYAIEVTQKNFPNTIQIGDIRLVDVDKLPIIDIIIGGSPCQGFSFSGKGLNFEDPRSVLFFEFVRILNQIKILNPNVKFILENVKMKHEHELVISKHLGVAPIEINSKLLSAQNRPRLYWTNINQQKSGLFGFLESNIPQPNDLGIKLSSILESGICDRDKRYCLDANYWKGTSLEQYYLKSRRQVVFTEKRTDEARAIRSESLKRGVDFSPRRAKELVPRLDEKCNCLTTSLTNEHILLDDCGYFRKLTPIECERLQTVPDNYTNHVSNTQRYKMLGNGWTVDVIVYILSFM